MRLFYKPLLLLVTAFNVFLFVSLFGSRGEGSPILNAYLSPDNSGYHLSDLALMQRVIAQIDRDYVDPDRIDPEKMLDKAFERIQRDIPELMFEREGDSELLVIVGDQQKSFTVDPCRTLDDLVDTMKLSLSFVEQHLDPSVSLRDVEYAAINGFLSTLDPHSVLLPPDMAREMDVQIQGEFGGLGITISLRGEDNILTVINTLPDTPAARIGLKAGDQIVQIEEESTINMSLNEAVSKLRGPVGTTVNIYIDRQSSEEPKLFSVRRETIRIESIVSDDLGDNIGYVHIKAFQHTTSRDLTAALEAYRDEQELKGLVLDLRKNPGGPLQQAIDVSDKFVDSGVVVMTVQSDERDSRAYTAGSRNTEEPYPVVVIVDSDSASASEIVAGALKNLDRAVIIGDQTFGKGSVQNLYTHRDESKLKLTIAKYLTPGRKSIQSLGITPDIRLLPVYFDDKSTFFYSTRHIFREKDLDRHFEQVQPLASQEKPEEVVRYFSPKDFKEYLIGMEDDEKEAKEEVAEPKREDPKQDYQVQFAKDLILKAGRPTRHEMLRAARDYIHSAQSLREAEIQEHFEALGIDWSSGRRGETSLVAELTLGDGKAPLRAGDTAKVAVTVKNQGKVAAHQVRALTECELGPFRELEFLFGKIAPGESRTYTRDVKVPMSVFSLVEPITVKLFENAEKSAGETETALEVDGLPQPAFAYSLVVTDDGSGMSRGNGDGRIQRGEDIDLVVMMKNIGEGPSSRALAKIRNESGKDVYLKRGTANLKTIEPGQWLEGRFHFKVRDGLQDGAIKFDLIAGDAAFMRRPKTELVLPVDSGMPTALEHSEGLATIAGAEPVSIYGGLGRDTVPFAQAKPGTVVKVNGKMTDWLRVEVPWEQGTMNGWLPVSQLEMGGAKASAADHFSPIFEDVPPLLTVPLVQRNLPNSSSELQISGDVSDDKAISSIAIFVNNKKRYLHSVPESEAVHLPSGEVSTHFATNIPLEEGTNTIEIYARDSDKLQSMDVFQVYRAKSDVVEQAVLDSNLRAGEAAAP